MQPDLIAGRYRVRHAVGRGGMGTVWLCHDEVLGRDVAVKQVGRLPGESLSDTARALREARSSAALNHHNVVSVFDVVEDKDENWLVMEYVPSRTLAEIIREDGPLTPQRAARIGAQVADGLAAAHAHGTVHRDVKPGNVLVGKGDLTKISDFGIARPAGDSQLTQTGLLTGTPTYFSPELARGGDPSPASDVWALGATLYAAVEGRPPYPEQRNALSLLTVIASEPPRPSSQAGVLTEPLARMLDPNPASRWSMADAAHALRRLADGQPPGVDDRETAVIAAPVPGPSAPSGPVAAEPDHEDRPRTRPLPWLVAVLALLAVAGAGYLMLGAGGGETPAAAPQDSTSSPPGTERSTRPSESKSAEPSPRSTPPPKDAAAAKVRFVETYFATVPDDTDAGWDQLAPSMQQEVGRDDYEAWWGSIDSVEATDVTPVAGEPAVNVVLTYSFDDGRVVEERQLIRLQPTGGEYLVAGDEVLSSRTVDG